MTTAPPAASGRWTRAPRRGGARAVLAAVLALTAPFLPAAELQRIEQAERIPTAWADGDSFQVRFPDGREVNLRLYGVDCLESEVRDESDARRLRAQRRYFGISGAGGSPAASIALARGLGKEAAERTAVLLDDPFTVHTAFADGRGDPRYPRVYAFITTAAGKDLSSELVRLGLARAYGVTRSTPGGLHQDNYRDALKDLELVAARRGTGIWKHTDWDALPKERSMQRDEDAELRLAVGGGPPEQPVDLNRASRDELMRLPGIGEHRALQIIEQRPYKDVEELLRIKGIGPKILEELRPHVRVGR